MANFFARMMDAQTGGEGRYTFEASDDKMRRPADEVVDWLSSTSPFAC